MYQFSLDGIVPQDTKPYPFTDLQKTWLSEMRSGKYKQGRGWLKDEYNAYCCLGILCELAGLEAKKPYLSSKYYCFGGVAPAFGEYNLGEVTSRLPIELRQKALFLSDIGGFKAKVQFPGLDYAVADPNEGVDAGGHTSLAAMNDVTMIPTGLDGKLRAFNFKEIADYIEFDPWNVFKEPAELISAG